jgi:hypothetical protein
MPVTASDELPKVVAAVAASVETMVVAATGATRVFLLRLPSGRPLLRGTNNIAAKLLSFFGSPPGGRACGLPTRRILQLWVLQEHLQKTLWEQGQAGGERGLLGEEDDGAAEWETLLEISEALKER